MNPGAADDFPATASAWALRLSGDDLHAPERQAFALWLAGGSGRLREVKEALAILRMSGALRDSKAAHMHLNESLRLIHKDSGPVTPFPRRRAVLAGAASLAAAGLVAGVFLDRRASAPPVLGNHARVATAVGAIEHFNLSDNSLLTVGASSAVQMAFTDTRRQISLHKGKAFFEVAHSAARPFVVTAGSHRVVVTGTKFNVSYNGAKDRLEVAVVEGSVNVGPAGGGAAAERLTPGAVSLFSSGAPGVARTLTPEQASAWRTGVLYFDDTAVDDLLTDVNGYLPKPLVAAENLSDLTLTAQLPAGDTQAALYVLREVLGLDSREHPDRWELSRAVQ